jgi:hypothetical protein
MDQRVKEWGNEGLINPFVDIYNVCLSWPLLLQSFSRHLHKVIFQLTARAALCKEIADDPQKVARVRVLYQKIERSGDAKSHVFPWLARSTTRAKNDALKELYTLLSDIVEEKKKRSTIGGDAIQTMVELGDSTPDIVGVSR